MDSVSAKDLFKKLKYEESVNEFGFAEFVKPSKSVGKMFIKFNGNGFSKEDSYGRAYPVNQKELKAINKYYEEKENKNEKN